MKVKQEDFELFKKHFTEYQKMFGLTGYETYIKFERLGGCFANVVVRQDSMVATVCLNKECDVGSLPFLDVRKSAKHEALHLLLGRFAHLARSRYASKEEIYVAEEEIVNKLEKLVKE